MLPTGTPARRLVLAVAVRDAADVLLASEKRIYQKALVDKDGRVLKAMADQMLEGVAVGQDNRIAPGEMRVEEFFFAIPKAAEGTLRLSDVLFYESEGPVRVTQVQMASDNTTVQLPWRGWWVAAWASLLGGLVAFVLCKSFSRIFRWGQ